MIECLSGAEAVARAPFIAGILARAFSDPAQRWSAESVAESCGTPGTLVLLAPHGCALIRIVADEAELLAIARDPIARGQGVGAELLDRSEEHTSELQSRGHLVCRLLLDKQKETEIYRWTTPEDTLS